MLPKPDHISDQRAISSPPVICTTSQFYSVMYLYGEQAVFFFHSFFNFTGPTIAVLCEYDALPGIGHGCGHNLIAEAGVAVAIGIKSAIEAKPDLGHLVVLGTPAEEGSGGKIDLINGGCFKDVDFCLMAHPAHLNVAFYKSMSIEEITITYHGHSTHAAAFPWHGVNALDAAVMAYTNISMQRQQMKPAWRIHGIFTEAGTKPNVIPERAKLHFFLRTTENKDHEILKSKAFGCFEAAAQATGCKVEITCNPSAFACMSTNEIFAKVYQQNAEHLGMKFPTREVQEALLDGSTDMGNVSLIVPSIHVLYTIDDNVLYHSHAFREVAGTKEAHDKTIVVSKALVQTAIAVMSDPVLMKDIKEEFMKKQSSSS